MDDKLQMLLDYLRTMDRVFGAGLYTYPSSDGASRRLYDACADLERMGYLRRGEASTDDCVIFLVVH